MIGSRSRVRRSRDKVEVYLDGERLRLEPGRQVVPHGGDRGLGTDEILTR
ncbi:hypothetical protein ACFXKX_22715 [Streptomyces scopuliridis]